MADKRFLKFFKTPPKLPPYLQVEIATSHPNKEAPAIKILRENSFQNKRPYPKDTSDKKRREQFCTDKGASMRRENPDTIRPNLKMASLKCLLHLGYSNQYQKTADTALPNGREEMRL